MKHRSLKAGLLMWLLPALVLLVVASAAGVYSLQRKLLFQQFDQQLEKRAFAASRHLWTRFDRERDDEEADSLEGLAFIEFWDLDDGQLRRVLPDDHRPADRPLVEAPESRQPTHTTVTAPDGRELRVYALRMHVPRRPRRSRDRREEPDTAPVHGGQEPGVDEPGDEGHQGQRQQPQRPGDAQASRRTGDRLYLAAADLAPVRGELRQWATWLMVAGSGSVAIVVVVVLVGVSLGLRPLRTVSADIAAIDAAHLQRRVPDARVPAELRPVVGQLNGLLARLQRAFDRERSFLAAAAHELRTPLAGVRSQLEVSLRRERPAKDYRATLEGALESAVALQHIVDALLQISRLESGQVNSTCQGVDLSALLEEQRGVIDDLARQRRLDVRWSVSEDLAVRCNAELLRRILSNLLGNAAAYADEGSWLALEARACDGGIEIAVSNPASDLRREDLARLFEPFWRRDEARSDVGVHAGIGLAIVQQAVAAIDGEIATELSESGVLGFRLRLPTAERLAPVASARAASQ
jgi:signal transduction histidine kinase